MPANFMLLIIAYALEMERRNETFVHIHSFKNCFRGTYACYMIESEGNLVGTASRKCTSAALSSLPN
jgi:hypothetical protein